MPESEAVEDSILKTIKQMLMLGTAQSAFDLDIIIHINSALSALRQLGIGPDEGYRITGETETWTLFLAGKDDLDAVKSYVLIKVRLAFDPPGTSFVIAAFQEQLRELEFRINVHREERENPWEPTSPPSSLDPGTEI